jgi:hypothetical protein
MLFSSKKVQPQLTLELLAARHEQDLARDAFRREQALAQEKIIQEQTLAKIAELLMQIQNIHPANSQETMTPIQAGKIFSIMDKFSKLDPVKVDKAFKNSGAGCLAAAIISIGGKNLDKSRVEPQNRSYLVYMILNANLAERTAQEDQPVAHDDIRDLRSFRSEELSGILRKAVSEQELGSDAKVMHKLRC